MRIIIALAFLVIPQLAFAANREAPLGAERGRGDIRGLEQETALQRDLMGRKLVIDPNSVIDPGSLHIDMAPGSTVVIRARQIDKGVQTTKTPLYKNVEYTN